MFDALIIVSELMRNSALAIAGGLGAWFAWLKIKPEIQKVGIAENEYNISRRMQVYEVFQRSAEQLTNNNLLIRLSAIYSLRELAQAFPDLADPVYDLLEAFVNEYVGNDEADVLFEDIEAAIDILLKPRS